MNNPSQERFLPNAADARFDDQDHADEVEHGVNAYEFPSDTLDELALRETRHLASTPLTAYILTHDFHSFLLALQHWYRKGYYCSDSSVVVCNQHLQSVQLFRPL